MTNNTLMLDQLQCLPIRSNFSPISSPCYVTFTKLRMAIWSICNGFCDRWPFWIPGPVPLWTCYCSNWWDQIAGPFRDVSDISPWTSLGTFLILLSGCIAKVKVTKSKICNHVKHVKWETPTSPSPIVMTKISEKLEKFWPLESMSIRNYVIVLFKGLVSRKTHVMYKSPIFHNS